MVGRVEREIGDTVRVGMDFMGSYSLAIEFSFGVGGR